MSQLHNFYPPPLQKDIERRSETHTYTDKPYSHFDPTNDEITSNPMNRRTATFNDPLMNEGGTKILTKVRSMPQNEFKPLYDVNSRQ